MADALLRDQKATGKRIINFAVNTEKLGELALTLDVVQTRLTLLERYWTEVLQRHLKLQSYETEKADDEYFADDLFTVYETEYSLAKSKLRCRIAAFVEQAQANDEHVAAVRDAPFQVQSTASSLPKLKLPTFTGKQEEWDTFKEVFSSMVKDVPSLTPVLKLQHLMSCLEGEAARRLANFEVIGPNFDVAWSALCRRYDNKRLRQAVQLLRLLNMEPVTQRLASEFTRLLDTAGQCIRALQRLSRPVEHWDDWFVHVLVIKLDQHTREDWEKSLEGSDEYPSYEKLSSFLENRVKSLDNAHCSLPSVSTPSAITSLRTKPGIKENSREKQRSVNALHTLGTPTTHVAAVESSESSQEGTAKPPCAACQGAHFIARCPVFLQSTVSQRRGVAEQLKLCENCLRPNHSTSSCPSKYRCSVCQEGHHSTLHISTPASELASGSLSALAPAGSTASQGTHTYVSHLGGPVLLGTARVLLESNSGLRHEARVLIDPASEGHILTERMVQLLRLRKSMSQTTVHGVGGVSSIAASMVHASVRSMTNRKFVVSFSALVLPKLTSRLPTDRVQRHAWPHLKGLALADPNFHQPGEIDGILGADFYALIIQEGLRTGEKGTPVAQLTKLGWILTGPTRPPVENEITRIQSFMITLGPAASLSEELRRSWEIEETFPSTPITLHKQECEDDIGRTCQRDDSRRLVIRSPFRDKSDSATTNHERMVVGFSYASEQAYVATVYSVARGYDGVMQSHLIALKTRVAPTRALTVSRHELCAAVILGKLMSKVLVKLQQTCVTVHCLTDSQAVLAWLREPPSTWPKFVANRVSTIITLLPDVTWRYVRSAENPAILALRGMASEEVTRNTLWCHVTVEEPPLQGVFRSYDERVIARRDQPRLHVLPALCAETLPQISSPKSFEHDGAMAGGALANLASLEPVRSSSGSSTAGGYPSAVGSG